MKRRILLGLLLLGMTAAVQAQYSYIGFQNTGTAIIDQYDGPGGAVIIPSTVGGFNVTVIAGYCFMNSAGVTSVTIPNGVTNIEDNAFTGCTTLTNVTFGSGPLIIGNSAFYQCGIEGTLALPTNVNSIGSNAFYANTAITNLDISNGVTSIGEGAFGQTSISSVTIPASVTNIPGNPFPACPQLTAINVAASNIAFTTVGGVLFDPTETTLIGYPAGAAASSYDVPVGVVNIAGEAFSGGTNLTNVTLIEGITNIGYEVFSGCLSLTNIAMPDSLISIGPEAFIGCTALTNATIPANVSNIGYAPFASCMGLKAIVVDTNNPTYASLDGVLFNKTQTTLIEYPTGGGSNTYTIPSGVTNLADYAFWGCSTLANVTFPSGVASIGTVAFAGCSNLVSANLSNGLVNIGIQAFYGCGMLTNATIPDGVGSIGFSAFQYCSALQSATIPASITNFGSGVFANSGLRILTLKEGLGVIGQLAFFGCPNLESAFIPASVTNIGMNAFSACGVTNATFESGLSSIGEFMFDGCQNLVSVVIPASVTNIGIDAFTASFRLAGIYFEGNVPSTGIFRGFIAGSPTVIYYLPGTSGWSSAYLGAPIALWKPAIQGSGLRGGQFGFNISWASNLTVTVQANSDLTTTNWTALQSCTLTNGSFYFSDATTGNSGQKFYRLSWP